jgi:prefoldin alpha subunit
VDEKEVESLTPVGIGVYIKTLVPPIKKLLINVGAGVTIEKTKEDTVNYVEAKIKEFELGLRELLNQKQQLAIRMEQIQAQINQMLQKTPTTASDSRQASRSV